MKTDKKAPIQNENKKKKGGWDTQTLKRLVGTLGARRFEAGLALGTAVIASACQLVAPLLIGKGIDEIIGPGQVRFSGLAKIAFLLLGLYVVGSLMQWLVSLASNRLAQRAVEDLRTQAFDNLSKLPLSYYDTHAHGDILNRLSTDVDAVADGLQQTVLQLFTGLITIVGTLVIMLVLNVWIALVVVVITLVAVAMARFITSHSNEMFFKQAQRGGDLNALSEEIIAGHREVLLYGMAEPLQEKYEQKDERLYRVGQKAQFFSSLVNPSTRFINNVAYVLVGLLSGLMALYRGMSIGEISAMLSYATQFAKPINEISSVSTQAQSALASARRIYELIDETPEAEEAADMKVLSRPDGNVSFQNVDFAYVPDHPLIEGLDLEAKAGQTVAIVGPTGAGKTTIVNLLMRFYEIDEGAILIDDIDSRAVTRDSLRKSFAMVLQETWLFSGTVRENIAYGRPDASEEQIVAAARAARADGFIRRLPDGYDTMIDESGDNMSQGERQLLTIARALLTEPPMLILDEATSSVDTLTEMAVQKAFSQAMQNRTSFVIAHRLSTIEHADLILVLNAGHIVEQGTHQSLLEKDGFYAKLYRSQFQQAM